MKIAVFFFWMLVLLCSLHGFDREAVLLKAGSNAEEVASLISASDAQGYGTWARFLLTSMEDVDLVNLKASDFLTYFKMLKINRERVTWGNRIDGFLFQHYILPHRVSQEPLENFTALYADTLYGLIKDVEDMREAVLRINEWTFTRMKYEPTSRWDQDAVTTIERGFGRCEEMAILCIKAMRSVCIPARKVYTPWWPFTNSNHAWVEVWVDGKWHFLGGAEPTDLEHAWFNTPAKRAAMVMGVVYGDMEPGMEFVYKQEKGYTVINSTPNYAEVTALHIRVLKDGAPQESVSVALCVYNYSSLPPVAIKKTDSEGYAAFTVGRTDLFVYAAYDSCIDYGIWKASGEKTDTMVLRLSPKAVPDTAFWMHTRRIEQSAVQPSYEPNRDSLKLLQELHLKRITMVDSSLAAVLPPDERKRIMIFYHAKGRAPALLAFYRNLPDSLEETFLQYGDALHAKDLASIDTTGLREELYAVRQSLAWAERSIPDSICSRYVISGRLLFEQRALWRASLQRDYLALKKARISRTAGAVFDSVAKGIEKIEKRGYFSPMKSPLDVQKTGRGTDGERYLFAVAILRSLGIPARVKWSYDALEYWNGEWYELRFEAEEQECGQGWLDLRFFDDGEEVSGEYRYYYDFSVTRFEEYPKRLDPPVDTTDGSMVITLDRKSSAIITGWRNAYGDTYVRIKPFEPGLDTLKLDIETGIPEDIGPGDLVAREYRGLDVESFPIERSALETGKVLVVVFELEAEASTSTLLTARQAINGFSGKAFFFVKDVPPEKGVEFLRAYNIRNEKVLSVSQEIYRNKWNMRHLPVILYLRDGECVFWTEGLFLHLPRLLEDFE